MRISILFLLFVFIQVYSANSQTIVLDSESANRQINIGGNFWFLEEKDNPLSIEEIIEADSNGNFEKSGVGLFNPTGSSSFYWLKIQVDFKASGPWYLFIDEPRLQYVEFHYQTEGQWKRIRDGISVPANEKCILNNFAVFPISPGSGDSGFSTFYVRVRPESLPVPIRITSKKFFEEEWGAPYKLAFGFLMGIILFVSLNNFVIFINTRNNLRLLYSILAFSFFLSSPLLSGMGLYFSEFIYSNTIYLILSLGALGHILIVIYSSIFLRLKRYSRWLHAWTVIFAALAFTNLLAFQVLRNQHLYITGILMNFQAVLAVFTCFVNGIYVWTKVEKGQRKVIAVYSLSYILFFIFMGLTAIDIEFGIRNVFFVQYVDAGFLCEVIGLSVALNIQTEQERKNLILDRNKAQKENFMLIHRQNQMLEEKVHTRTAELRTKTEFAEKLNVKLQEMNGLKDKLFSIVSHDLRSPLGQLHSFVEIFEKFSNDTTEQKVIVNSILPGLKANLNHVRALTDDLLFWSKSQMGGFKLNPVRLNLHSMVEEKRQLLESQAIKKSITISNNVPQSLYCWADKNALAIVLSNLITNGVKFTKPGGKIAISAEEEEEVVIKVCDNGVGMDETKVTQLFRSVAVSEKGTSGEVGSGLGLIICHDLISRLGGSITVESQIGKGSTFTITIPKVD